MQAELDRLSQEYSKIKKKIKRLKKQACSERTAPTDQRLSPLTCVVNCHSNSPLLVHSELS